MGAGPVFFHGSVALADTGQFNGLQLHLPAFTCLYLPLAALCQAVQQFCLWGASRARRITRSHRNYRISNPQNTI